MGDPFFFLSSKRTSKIKYAENAEKRNNTKRILKGFTRIKIPHTILYRYRTRISGYIPRTKKHYAIDKFSS